MKKTHIAQTKNTGHGLFAQEPILKDEHIFVIEGTIRKDEYTTDEANSPYPNDLNISPGIWITPHDSNPWRYVNHSCNPNLGLKQDNDKFIAIAMKDITLNEELTINYAITEGNPYWQMECTCQQLSCVGIVRSIVHLSSSKFTFYKPYLLPALKTEWEKKNVLTIQKEI